MKLQSVLIHRDHLGHFNGSARFDTAAGTLEVALSEERCLALVEEGRQVLGDAVLDLNNASIRGAYDMSIVSPTELELARRQAEASLLVPQAA